MMGISNWCGENFIGWWAADFQGDVLEAAGRELMETQIILTCAVPLILYASVSLLSFFWFTPITLSASLSSNAKIPPH